jgi:hypothetical protein
MHHPISGETEIHDHSHDHDRRAEDGHEYDRYDWNGHSFAEIAKFANIDIFLFVPIDHDSVMTFQLFLDPLMDSIR